MIEPRKAILVSLLLLLAFLLPATDARSAVTVLMDESFESGFGDFYSEYGGSQVVDDGTTPFGSRSLRFSFSSGDPGGYAPDIVTAGFPSRDEIWGRAYFKLSAGYAFHPYEQKLIFIWGDTFNFYISIGSWTDHKMFGCWQGTGSTYRNSSGPEIKSGVWYKVDFHMKMNSGAGVKDGIFQLWLNDALVLDFSNVPYRGAGKGPDAGFGAMAFTPVYGGDSTPVPQNQSIWFDGAQIAAEPLGPAPSPAKPPAPPVRLRID